MNNKKFLPLLVLHSNDVLFLFKTKVILKIYLNVAECKNLQTPYENRYGNETPGSEKSGRPKWL